MSQLILIIFISIFTYTSTYNHINQALSQLPQETFPLGVGDTQHVPIHNQQSATQEFTSPQPQLTKIYLPFSTPKDVDEPLEINLSIEDTQKIFNWTISADQLNSSRLVEINMPIQIQKINLTTKRLNLSLHSNTHEDQPINVPTYDNPWLAVQRLNGKLFISDALQDSQLLFRPTFSPPINRSSQQRADIELLHFIKTQKQLSLIYIFNIIVIALYMLTVFRWLTEETNQKNQLTIISFTLSIYLLYFIFTHPLFTKPGTLYTAKSDPPIQTFQNH